jgi:hypothetical protein
VRLRCLHEAGLVRIEVMDTGIGIPSDQIPRIYDEFYQVGVAANSSRNGYGLGLSIVQRLVKLLTLRLYVQSQIGQGSAFSLLLPAGGTQAVPSYVRTKRSSAIERQLGTAHILLVEDDAAVRAATRMLLKVEGYQVTAVDSLAEALKHIHNGIDLLVTDYHLSEGETGLQLITACERLSVCLLRRS